MTKIDLPLLAERYNGFTVPEHGRFLVVDADEVQAITIAADNGVDVAFTDDAPHAIANAEDFVGWFRGTDAAIHQSGSTTIAYEFDPRASEVEIGFSAGGETGSIRFPIFSGDWFAASLSREGDLLVLAEPYRIDAYRLV